MNIIKNSRDGAAVRALSVASFISLAFCGLTFGSTNSAYADDTQVVLDTQEANNILIKKSIEETTLDYLKGNNILIPQKKYDDTTNTWVDGGLPITSPESAYTIKKLIDEEVTAYEAEAEADRDKMVFKYTTADNQGNLTNTYYRAALKPQKSVNEAIIQNIGTSNNIKWAETPFPGDQYTATGSFDFKVSDTETKTYYYAYTKPEGWDKINARIENTLDANNANNKLFKDISTTNNFGGAIYNTQNGADININADFVNNVINYSGTDGGGAVYNGGILGNITGDFINNKVESSITRASTSSFIYNYGGAIANIANSTDNTVTIGDIKGDFINNSLKSTLTVNSGSGVDHLYGGAIANCTNSNGATVKISNISGDYIGNSLTLEAVANKTGDDKTSADGYVYGGAIANYVGISNSKAEIDDLSGDFIGNSVTVSVTGSGANSSHLFAYGGAIANYSYSTSGTVTIGNITGNFINNSVNGSGYYASAEGGAIRNNGTIGNITGDFINNSTTVLNNTYHTYGGAIYNSGTLGNINGNFIKNNTNSSSSSAYGGAIYNYSSNSIGDITGDFINNRATGARGAYGGVIYNDRNSSIGNITGDFINNSAIASSNGTVGGIAIYNKAAIGDVTGDFINNSANANIVKDGSGRGIYYNYGAIANFVDNSRDTATIRSISGNFIGNTLKSTMTLNNSTSSWADGFNEVFGGAIANIANYGKTEIGNITGNFIGNSLIAESVINKTGSGSTSANNYAYGGAIANYGRWGGTAIITNIKGDFSDNSAKNGGAIINFVESSDATAKISNITGDFINNSASFAGGAIWNGVNGSSGGTATINDISGDFTNNSTSVGAGGAIYNSGTIKNISGNFTNNSTADTFGASGGGIYNSGTISSISGDFINNSAGNGGAIYNGGTIDNIINSSFRNNHAKNNTFSAHGGAIYTGNKLNIIAKNGYVSIFDGNYTEYKGVKDDNAIWVNPGTLTFKMQDDGKFLMNDNISGSTRGGLDAFLAVYGYDTFEKYVQDFFGYDSVDEFLEYEDFASIDDYLAMEGYGDIYVNITGDGSDTKFTLNNKINGVEVNLDNTHLKLGVTDPENSESDNFKTSKLTVNSGIVDTKDNEYTNFNIKELVSSETARYAIDMVLNPDEQKSDTFTLTKGGSGIVYLSSINVTNTAGADEEYTIQIIKAVKGQDAPQLAYNESKVLHGATAHMDNQMILGDDFGLVTTTTLNDSIRIRGLKDVLAEWLEYTPNADEEKIFDFLDNTGYTLSRDITGLNGDSLTINGQGNTLDLNNKNAFSEIGETQTLKISDLTITNIDKIENNGIVEFDKVNLETGELVNNNTLTQTGGILTVDKLTNAKTLTATDGSIIAKVFTNSGSAEFKNVKLNAETFENQNTLTAVGGTLTANTLTNSGSAEFENVTLNAETFENQETLTAVGGTLTANTLSNRGSAELKNVTLNAETFENQNTLTAVGGTLTANTLTNSGSAEFENVKLNAETFENQEALTAVGGTLTANSLTNSGEISIKGTALDAESLTNSNKFMASDSELKVQNLTNDSEITLDTAKIEVVTLTSNDRGKLTITNSNLDQKGLIANQDITNNSGTMNLINPKDFVNNSLILENGIVNLASLASTDVLQFNHLTLNGNINLDRVDVDLANKTMGQVKADTYGENPTGTISVNGMNILTDSPEAVTVIKFVDNELKNNVQSNLPKGENTFTGLIYKYSVDYNNDNTFGNDGYYVFTKGAASSSGNPSDAFNPAVLSAPVSSVAAAQSTINETFKYVFEHADAFTQMPSHVRFAKINANKYALSTDFNDNIPMSNLNNQAAWFRPYTTFETMNLKNGPKVDAITYGSLVGFDTEFQEHKNGWYSVGTGYIGYNGSQLSYSGVDTTMNGGILGYTHTMYKGNFWTALTATAGASVGQSTTMYGKEDFTSLMAGLGSKTGYNFEFKEGKYILQPIMFLGYTFVNTFDYRNAAGVKINADPAYSIQLNPSVRFITNTKNGWQPYASVGMVWNVMNENKVTANSVRLPEIGMKPYVEYGIGVQRNWKDRFIAFGQAMLRNGGRNGIVLSFGFRWALGSEGKKGNQGRNEKVQNSTPNKVVLKQLTTAPKAALGAKTQNITRTIYRDSSKRN